MWIYTKPSCLPLQHMGASCADILRASAGFIGRRLTLVHHLYRGKRPSHRKHFPLQMLDSEHIFFLPVKCTSEWYILKR